MPPPRCKLGGRFDYYTKGMFCAFVLGLHPSLGKKLDQFWVKTFFLLFIKFWAKNWTKFDWRPFFFALHLILGKKSGLISDSDLSSQILWSSYPPLFKILRTLLVGIQSKITKIKIARNLNQKIFHKLLILINFKTQQRQWSVSYTAYQSCC